MNMYSINFLLCVVFVTNFITAIAAKKYNREKLQIQDEYEKKRAELMHEEDKLSLGGKIQLNGDEIIVNNILMKLKDREYEYWKQNPAQFNFSRSYFTYRDQIEKSQIYQIIKGMPKGGALHVHSTLALGAEYMLNLTYIFEENLHICQTNDHINILGLLNHCSGRRTSLNHLRNSHKRKHIDRQILNLFSFGQHFKEDVNAVWDQFTKITNAVLSLIQFRPVREKFIYDMLQAFYDDNVMYIEIRSGIAHLYEFNGTVYDELYTVWLHQEVTTKFKNDHPDFIGMKLILTKYRQTHNVEESLKFAKDLQKSFPDFFAGFDLVGQEDLGRPLHDFLPEFLEVQNDINFYFHGGETNWSGFSSDDNLYDAILLGTKRIGHANSLIKHPVLMQIVLQNNIALEVNVISNAVLALVGDVRNHPLSTYLALDLPVVLSSDDPGAWGAAPLSHDFYVAFLGVSNKRADLRMLKQLAINSITYSALDDAGKRIAMQVFDNRWNTFLDHVKYT